MSSMFSHQHCMPPMYALNSPYQHVGPGFAPMPYNTPAMCYANGYQGKLDVMETCHIFLVTSVTTEVSKLGLYPNRFCLRQIQNPGKSGSGEMSSRIWRMPLQLQYVKLITDKN